jgi:hypothetical protein
MPVSSPLKTPSTADCTHSPRESLPMLSMFCVPSNRSLETEAWLGSAVLARTGNKAAVRAALRPSCCCAVLLSLLAAAAVGVVLL